MWSHADRENLEMLSSFWAAMYWKENKDTEKHLISLCYIHFFLGTPPLLLQSIGFSEGCQLSYFLIGHRDGHMTKAGPMSMPRLGDKNLGAPGSHGTILRKAYVQRAVKTERRVLKVFKSLLQLHLRPLWLHYSPLIFVTWDNILSTV